MRDDYETYADNHPAMIAYLQSLLDIKVDLVEYAAMKPLPRERILAQEVRILSGASPFMR